MHMIVHPPIQVSTDTHPIKTTTTLYRPHSKAASLHEPRHSRLDRSDLSVEREGIPLEIKRTVIGTYDGERQKERNHNQLYNRKDKAIASNPGPDRNATPSLTFSTPIYPFSALSPKLNR